MKIWKWGCLGPILGHPYSIFRTYFISPPVSLINCGHLELSNKVNASNWLLLLVVPSWSRFMIQWMYVLRNTMQSNLYTCILYFVLYLIRSLLLRALVIAFCCPSSSILHTYPGVHTEYICGILCASVSLQYRVHFHCTWLGDLETLPFILGALVWDV